MYWIPNCITPGDSASPSDSLVEFERNMAQVIVTITDSSNNVIAYDNHSFQYPGFDSHTVWYSNYSYSPAGEKCYLLNVTGTSLYGTKFSMSGTVSLLRYFFGNDSIKTSVLTKVHCDSCSFNQQWTGNGVNYNLPSGITFVPDATHECN